MKFKDYNDLQKQRYVIAAKKLESYLKLQHGYNCHLGFGSLLGAAREGKLIDSDYDIDLCVILPSQDTEKHAIDLFNDLIKKGWLKRIFTKDQNYIDNPKQAKNILGQAHIHIDGCVVDLFVAWNNNERYTTCQWGDLGKYEGETKLKLEGVNFKAPSNYDEILNTLYRDWRTPSNDHPSKYLVRKCRL
jgi:phosphorylcholine metabolism protein LicD